jgi:hypothetical protein
MLAWPFISIVSKKLNAPYRSGPSRSWIKVKPEGTRRNSRYRWHLLTLGFPASNLVLERTKG